MHERGEQSLLTACEAPLLQRLTSRLRDAYGGLHRRPANTAYPPVVRDSSTPPVTVIYKR